MAKSEERRRSCPNGPAWRHKREAEAVSPGMHAYHCHRCRGWHVKPKRGKKK